MAAVLGIKCGPQHDTGAALVFESEKELRCIAISEERLSRKKQCRDFPTLSIKACLEAAGIQLSDIDLICVDKLGSFAKTDQEIGLNNVDPSAWQQIELDFFKKCAGVEIVIVNHHLCHAASAFCVQDRPSAACLVVDGSGSDYPTETSDDRLFDMGSLDSRDDHPLKLSHRRAETQSIFFAERNQNGSVNLIRKATSTRSGVGHFYSFFSKYDLGFGHLQEGKAMGLAGWGDPELAEQFGDFPDSVFQGINTSMLTYLMKTKHAYKKRIDQPATSPRYAARAWWMQESLSQAMLHLAEHAIEITDSNYLCMAGGVALNVVTNRLIRDRLVGSGKIDGMFVQPASSDAGMPLGAALYGYYTKLGRGLPFQKNIVYLGPEPDRHSADRLMIENGATISDNMIRDVADLLLEEKIVGWWQGRSEYGPRALGARSILCWPRPKGMKDHLNLRVKHREAFRPFAPIVREESAPRIFDADFPVPYMLFNTRIRDEFIDRIPAVAHIDGSGRLQTVSQDRIPILYELLGEIERRDGIGVLLNTSFNDAGEPIVESVEDAISCFHRTGLDALVCGNAILTKDKIFKDSRALTELHKIALTAK